MALVVQGNGAVVCLVPRFRRVCIRVVWGGVRIGLYPRLRQGGIEAVRLLQAGGGVRVNRIDGDLGLGGVVGLLGGVDTLGVIGRRARGDLLCRGRQELQRHLVAALHADAGNQIVGFRGLEGVGEGGPMAGRVVAAAHGVGGEGRLAGTVQDDIAVGILLVLEAQFDGGAHSLAVHVQLHATLGGGAGGLRGLAVGLAVHGFRPLDDGAHHQLPVGGMGRGTGPLGGSLGLVGPLGGKVSHDGCDGYDFAPHEGAVPPVALREFLDLRIGARLVGVLLRYHGQPHGPGVGGEHGGDVPRPVVYRLARLLAGGLRISLALIVRRAVEGLVVVADQRVSRAVFDAVQGLVVRGRSGDGGSRGREVVGGQRRAVVVLGEGGDVGGIGDLEVEEALQEVSGLARLPEERQHFVGRAVLVLVLQGDRYLLLRGALGQPEVQLPVIEVDRGAVGVGLAADGELPALDEAVQLTGVDALGDVVALQLLRQIDGHHGHLVLLFGEIRRPPGGIAHPLEVLGGIGAAHRSAGDDHMTAPAADLGEGLAVGVGPCAAFAGNGDERATGHGDGVALVVGPAGAPEGSSVLAPHRGDESAVDGDVSGNVGGVRRVPRPNDVVAGSTSQAAGMGCSDARAVDAAMAPDGAAVEGDERSRAVSLRPRADARAEAGSVALSVVGALHIDFEVAPVEGHGAAVFQGSGADAGGSQAARYRQLTGVGAVELGGRCPGGQGCAVFEGDVLGDLCAYHAGHGAVGGSVVPFVVDDEFRALSAVNAGAIAVGRVEHIVFPVGDFQIEARLADDGLACGGRHAIGGAGEVRQKVDGASRGDADVHAIEGELGLDPLVDDDGRGCGGLTRVVAQDKGLIVHDVERIALHAPVRARRAPEHLQVACGSSLRPVPRR